MVGWSGLGLEKLKFVVDEDYGDGPICRFHKGYTPQVISSTKTPIYPSMFSL